MLFLNLLILNRRRRWKSPTIMPINDSTPLPQNFKFLFGAEMMETMTNNVQYVLSRVNSKVHSTFLIMLHSDANQRVNSKRFRATRTFCNYKNLSSQSLAVKHWSHKPGIFNYSIFQDLRFPIPIPNDKYISSFMCQLKTEKNHIIKYYHLDTYSKCLAVLNLQVQVKNL